MNSKARVKVVAVNETEEFQSGFKKRTMEGMIEGEYPEVYLFEFIKDKVDLLDDVLEGTYVTVHCNVKGRKVTEKSDGTVLEKPMYFTTLQGWKVEV